MASDVIDIGRSRKPDRTRLRLVAELADVASRLHSEAEVPQAGIASGDFLDIAQGMEQQERARLSATRLADRARRLREALARAAEGEYGVCSECGEAIPARRLTAVPDATTCVTCQSRLEGVGSRKSA
ncbi:MAG TPA: TraR/DksA family transcriptional regulator [Methylomirabilota bacterium]|jgi:DnaK suppressor protein|nr:TraR/DksA family transcriptional regulator [Methylomirabilota bacterium]